MFKVVRFNCRDSSQLLAVNRAHGFAGLGVIGGAQLHGTVQIQFQRFCGEAKHIKAVADGGTFPVVAGAVQGEGNRAVVRTPGKGGRFERQRGKSQPRARTVLTHSGAGRDGTPLWRLGAASAWPNTC